VLWNSADLKEKQALLGPIDKYLETIASRKVLYVDRGKKKEDKERKAEADRAKKTDAAKKASEEAAKKAEAAKKVSEEAAKKAAS
jgi:membrane protein involved in colicin uptake